jgi:hypothetical protein
MPERVGVYSDTAIATALWSSVGTFYSSPS